MAQSMCGRKELQRIAVNDSPEKCIDLEFLIAMLQLLQNEMQPDLGKITSNWKQCFKTLSNRINLQKYSSISAGGDHSVSFMKWFENDYCCPHSRPTSLFKLQAACPDSTNDMQKYV